MRKAEGGPVDAATDEWVKTAPPAFAGSKSEPDKWMDAPSPVWAKEQRSSLQETALYPTAKFNSAVADVAGIPVDLSTWAVNKGIQGVNAIAGYPVANELHDLPGGSDSIKRGMNALNINTGESLGPAQTTVGQLTGAAGEGAGMMVAPEAGLASLTRAGVKFAPRVLDAAQKVFGAAESVPAMLKNAIVGAGGGTAGDVAKEMVPEQYKPLANMAGNIVGGGITALGTTGAEAAGRTALDASKRFVAPLAEGGRERLAAETLGSRATNRAEALDRLQNPADELVPGSEPTTFQATGDMGLGSLEREVATRNPAEFMQRRAEQNAARLDALQGLERNGSPTDVSNAVRQQLQSIDQMTADAVSRATDEATARVEGLGGQGTAEAYGASLRDHAAQARVAAKEQERALWRAVDPDNTLALPVSTLKDAAEGVAKSVTSSAKPVTGEERAILDTIGQYRGVMPFSEVTDLRSRVSAAMREEMRAAGETPVYARLSRLRGAIENTIAGAVEHKAAQEASAVARGDLNPDETIAAAIQRQIDEWRTAKAKATGTSGAGETPAASSGRTFAIPSAGGAAGSRGRRPADAKGNQGLPGNYDLQPNFDEAARGRLNAATQATRDRVQTFDKGPVGQALRTSGMQGQYRAADAAVPAQIFKRGPTGAQSVEAYRTAVGTPQAMGILGDYAAASLRQAAVRPDGTLDPARFASWRKAHSDALRAMPELAARFEDAATASRAIEDVAAIRRDALEQYQRGVFGQLAKADNVEDVTRIIGGLFGQKDSAKAMRDFVKETRNNPAAKEGLRKAIAEHILNKFISNTEAGSSELGLLKSDQFQTFVRNNAGALRQVFTEPEVNSLRAIAADLQRANRSISAVKLPGGSNTAQDTAARQLSILNKIIHHGRETAAGAAAGFGAAAPFGLGPIGALAGSIGGSVVTALREAGLKRVDDLIRDAMLNPELARKLLAKGPDSGSKGRQISLAQYLRRNAAASLFQNNSNSGNED